MTATPTPTDARPSGPGARRACEVTASRSTGEGPTTGPASCWELELC